VRVIDFTAWWAGPSATQLLGTLGADVVKVESASRPDLIRYASVKGPADADWWEWGPLFAAANTNKRSVTLDLTTAHGHELVLRLIAGADMVVENFTPRVMPQLGLDVAQLHAVNPRLIMLRMPAFGLDGPWRDRTGFAQTMESVTGMAAVTGYPDGPPLLVRGAGDPLAGLHACFAGLVALVARAADGQGRLVESTMVEAVLNAAVEPVVAYQLTGRVLGRLGNRSPDGLAPQGVYRCRGEDAWVALTVADDEQWRALTSVLGAPAAAVPLDRAEERARAHDELDTWLSAVCADWEVRDLAEALRRVGVAAAEVIVPATLAQNPQLVHRGLFEELVHPVTGANHLPGMPYRMSGVPGWLRRPAPTLGQHNAEILAEVGVGAAERDDLARRGVIGDAPKEKEGGQGA
jgi:crotonobetainyl-CoA:carnitine CoA-transferase CaiB-like acyl-CoA transferase